MLDKTSASNRLAQIDTDYQLVIIGGGIYGAALCWEATHRGIKTLLIEQEDYGCGASSNSLKTIHGGLRSLQSFNLKAVIKGIRERAAFLRIAPNYVKPLPCILPTTKSLMKSKPVVGMGLLLYNILSHLSLLFSANHKNTLNSRLLSRTQFLNLAPGINPEGLTGGALWYDAQVKNTERLVWLFIKSAIKKGASAINHSIALKHDQDKLNRKNSVLIRDQITGLEKTVTTAVIIDCSSAWNFIKQCLPAKESHEDITFLKSVNIIIKKNIFKHAVGASTKAAQIENSRLYFLSPWRDYTMIGTWYSSVEVYPEVTFSENEASACISEINTIFSQKLFSVDDICNVHIGFLPANNDQHRNASTLDKSLLSNYQLKDWSDLTGMHNVYSLRGTKYTLARHDAKEVIDRISKTMEWKVAASRSGHLPLYHAVHSPVHVHSLSKEIVDHLLMDYGADIKILLSHIENNPGSTEVIPGTKYHIMAEIHYVVFYEQVLTLSDLIKRRLNIGDSAPPSLNTVQYCANIMQQLLSLSDETIRAQISELYAGYPEFLIRKSFPGLNSNTLYV